MNPSGPGVFVIDRLLIAASTSDLVIGLFRVSISVESVVISPLSFFYCIYLVILSFFFISLASGLSVLLIF